MNSLIVQALLCYTMKDFCDSIIFWVLLLIEMSSESAHWKWANAAEEAAAATAAIANADISITVRNILSQHFN